MPVLFGVFLFMGVSSLKGVQVMICLSLVLFLRRKEDDISFKSKIDDLSCGFDKLDNQELVSVMKNLIPEYVSNNSEFEKLDIN